MKKEEIIKHIGIEDDDQIHIIRISSKDKSMTRTCIGISAYTLLGILSFIKQEICDQINGKTKPQIIKCQVIKE